MKAKYEHIYSYLQKNKLEDAYLSNDPSLIFHLCEKRKNLLSIVPFEENDDVLELSYNCEVLTSSYANRVSSVTLLKEDEDALEVSKLINKDIINIEYVKGDLASTTLNKKYSKILLIDGLEQGDYGLSLKETLIKAKSLLKEDGSIYLALNNKYSIRYFAGVSNETTNKLFDTIEESLSFSDQELIDIFNEVKMDYEFYYPLPNMYLADQIYSEEYLPHVGEISNITSSYFANRYMIFSEEKALNEAIRSKKFRTFAPSFLIEVK